MRALDPLLLVLERLEDIWISQSLHRVFHTSNVFFKFLLRS